MSEDIQTLVAKVLKVAPETVTDDLEYGAIDQWDSLAHVEIILGIESEYGLEIDEDSMFELTSVKALKAYVQDNARA